MDMVVPADSAIGLISSVMSSKFLMEAWSAHKKHDLIQWFFLIWSCENKTKRENGLECDLMVFSAANVSIFGIELHLHHPRGVHHLSVFSGQWPFTMKAPVPSIRKKKNTSSDQIKAQQMLGDTASICLHPKKAEIRLPATSSNDTTSLPKRKKKRVS